MLMFIINTIRIICSNAQLLWLRLLFVYYLCSWYDWGTV